MLKRRRTEQDELLDRANAPSAPAPPRPVRPRQDLAAPPPPATVRVEGPPRPRKSRRKRAHPARSLAILAGVLAVAYCSLPLLLRAERVRPVAEQTLSAALGRAVHIGSLKFTLGF